MEEKIGFILLHHQVSHALSNTAASCNFYLCLIELRPTNDSYYGTFWFAILSLLKKKQ